MKVYFLGECMVWSGNLFVNVTAALIEVYVADLLIDCCQDTEQIMPGKEMRSQHLLLYIYPHLINYNIKKRFLLRCVHHFKSDLIINMDHIRISGTKP